MSSGTTSTNGSTEVDYVSQFQRIFPLDLHLEISGLFTTTSDVSFIENIVDLTLKDDHLYASIFSSKFCDAVIFKFNPKNLSSWNPYLARELLLVYLIFLVQDRLIHDVEPTVNADTAESWKLKWTFWFEAVFMSDQDAVPCWNPIFTSYNILERFMYASYLQPQSDTKPAGDFHQTLRLLETFGADFEYIKRLCAGFRFLLWRQYPEYLGHPDLIHLRTRQTMDRLKYCAHEYQLPDVILSQEDSFTENYQNVVCPDALFSPEMFSYLSTTSRLLVARLERHSELFNICFLSQPYACAWSFFSFVLHGKQSALKTIQKDGTSSLDSSDLFSIGSPNLLTCCRRLSLAIPSLVESCLSTFFTNSQNSSQSETAVKSCYYDYFILISLFLRLGHRYTLIRAYERISSPLTQMNYSQQSFSHLLQLLDVKLVRTLLFYTEAALLPPDEIRAFITHPQGPVENDNYSSNPVLSRSNNWLLLKSLRFLLSFFQTDKHLLPLLLSQSSVLPVALAPWISDYLEPFSTKLMETNDSLHDLILLFFRAHMNDFDVSTAKMLLTEIAPNLFKRLGNGNFSKLLPSGQSSIQIETKHCKVEAFHLLAHAVQLLKRKVTIK